MAFYSRIYSVETSGPKMIQHMMGATWTWQDHRPNSGPLNPVERPYIDFGDRMPGSGDRPDPVDEEEEEEEQQDYIDLNIIPQRRRIYAPKRKISDRLIEESEIDIFPKKVTIIDLTQD